MQNIIKFLNLLFDTAWFAGSKVDKYIYIIIFCVISACIVLLLFKKLSNQEKIKFHRKKTYGYILQIPLYKDRFSLILTSVLYIFKHNMYYIRYAFSPLIVIVIPVFIISSQINTRCGYIPFYPGKTFIIQAEIDKDNKTLSESNFLDDVYCKTSSGLVLETPMLRIPEENKVYWRARVDSNHSEPTREYLVFGIKNKKDLLTRQVVTSHNNQRFAPEMNKWNIESGLIHNAEDFLPGESIFSCITLTYERADYPFLFWDLDPLILYFVFTLFFALLLKPVFKVTI